jgi:hypothetical protein
LQASPRGWAPAVQLRRGDGVAALRALAPASADLVLLDPPFDARRCLRPPCRPPPGPCGRRVSSTWRRPQRWGDAALAAAGLACTGI